MGAVAVPKGGGWERVATSYCRCKYEGLDALAEAVQLHPAPDPQPNLPERFELVLRASAGGTGIYTKNEGHFRVYHGELGLVMTFVSDRRQCDPTMRPPHYCEIEKRWFYSTFFGGTPGGVLVESKGRMPAEDAPEIEWNLRNVEDKYLKRPRCSTYAWNSKALQYLPAKLTDPCQPVKR